MRCITVLLAFSMPMVALAWTTAPAPADGVYKFEFGVNEASAGAYAVPASAVYDVQGTGYYTGETPTFTYGFLGTTETSYVDDTPVGSKVTDVRQIDGFSVVEGQYIVLSDTNDLNGVSCVCGPAAAGYLPANASPYEGRYPVRFAMRAEERAYYAVTCTVVNASSTANADVTLYSERSHLHAHHMTLSPGATRTFAWSVELAPNFCKAYSDSYRDNAINVCVVGENAALASVTVVKQPQVSGTVRGEAIDNMNVGKSIWICTDSTGCDYPMSIPFFSLQNYGGVGAGLSRWAPADISICNQGEGGLATNSKTHRQSCLLKPGDYLYVEYGHNEGGVTSYTNNLETYLSDAKTAGAKLLVVSPVERHTSWNSTTKYWEASLAGIRDGGRAWVEDKIAQGETCVAFIDLNTHYLNWMNSEVDRICTAFPSMNRSAAINYYYQSAKGKNVDGTHLNTAGEDQGAYWFWQAALAVVAAGESAEEGTSAKIQADVVKGITEGYQSTLGLGTAVANTPWLVTDEIIAAGVAPNSFWDTPVTTMLDYVNEAVVADVAAWTNADGTVTISNITMRILNPGNYYKAVIDIISADAATTNRYYSYYNYDVGGLNATSGTLIKPEQSGFLDSDAANGGAKDRETLTVPAGGKAYVWFAKADDATWQVGANAPCSARYPVEAWSKVLVDDHGEDASNWSAVTQSEYTFTENEAGYYDFTGTGYGSDGKTKKNFGMFRDFDDAGEISGGRYRVSFKALYTAGSFTFGVINAKGTTTSPTAGAVNLVQFTGKSAKVCGSEAAEVTLVKDANEELQPSNRINVDAWTDVDMIVDMDLGKAEVSVGGSDYQTYEIPAYSEKAAFPSAVIPNLPYRYFVFSLEYQMSHFGAIDDVKVMQLAASTERQVVTVSAAPNDANFGTVTIRDEDTNSFDIYSGASVALKAVSADPDMYAFVCWRDAGDNDVSSNATFVVENAVADCSYTAVFREYGEEEDRVVKWDFSDYIVDGIAATGNLATNYNGLAVCLQNGDSLSGDGLYWANVGSSSGSVPVGSTGRHIEWTAPFDGTMSVVFSVSSTAATGGNGKPVYVSMQVKDSDGTSIGSVNATTANTDTTLQFSATAGTTYSIYTYYYNRSSQITVKSITYAYAPVRYTATAAVGNPGLGGATVNGGATAEVLAGKSATFTAWPVTAAYRFVNWTDSDSNVASTETTFATNIIENVTYTANFEALEAGESVDAAVNFAQYAGDRAVSGGSLVTTNGYFTIYTSDSSYGTDAITENGIYWHAPANDIYAKNYSADQPCDYIHYMKFEPPYSGTVTIVFQADKVVDKRTLSLNITTGELSSATINNAIASTSASTANADFTHSYNVTANETYWIWGASQNWSGAHNATACTISSITYTHASDLTTLSLANDSEAGAVTVNGVAGVTNCNVQKGEYVKLSVAPNAGSIFGGWKNANDEIVSEESEIWVLAEDAISLTTTWRTADVHNFVWNPEVASGNWNDAANWLYEGLVPATTYPSDAACDVATIDTEATITLSSSATASNIWFNADATLTGGNTLSAAIIGGTGAITLSDAGFSNSAVSDLTISNNVVMVAGTTNWFNTVGSAGYDVYVRGNISGSGTLNVKLASTREENVYFYGNNNDFYGDAYTSGGTSNRSIVKWNNQWSAGTNTYWHVGHSYGNDNKDYCLMGGTVCFGGYDGAYWDRYDGNTLTIGYLNRDSAVSIYNGVSGRANSIVKVGTANLTLGTTRIKNLTVNGGSVTMPIGIAPNALTLAAGTEIRIAGDAAWEVGMVTNLFSYTTLSGATAETLPGYVNVTGLAEGLAAEISVKDNKVTATIKAAGPTTDDENADVEKKGDGSYKITVQAEEVTITVPDGVTVSEVVVSTNTTTVTGFPAGAEAKVAVSWAGGNANYSIVKVVDGAVLLDGTKSVTVGSEEIPVKPAFSDAGDEEKPMVVADDVSVGVKAIPGLVYRLVRGVTPVGIDTPIATEKATGARVSLVDNDPPDDAAFYQVTVDLK